MYIKSVDCKQNNIAVIIGIHCDFLEELVYVSIFWGLLCTSVSFIKHHHIFFSSRLTRHTLNAYIRIYNAQKCEYCQCLSTEDCTLGADTEWRQNVVNIQLPVNGRLNMPQIFKWHNLLKCCMFNHDWQFSLAAGV